MDNFSDFQVQETLQWQNSPTEQSIGVKTQIISYVGM